MFCFQTVAPWLVTEGSKSFQQKHMEPVAPTRSPHPSLPVAQSFGVVNSLPVAPPEVSREADATITFDQLQSKEAQVFEAQAQRAALATLWCHFSEKAREKFQPGAFTVQAVEAEKVSICALLGHFKEA